MKDTKYPKRQQPGKVNTHVKTKSFTIPHFTYETLLATPTPSIAVVFVCAVLTGRPNEEAINRQADAAVSAAKP